MKLSTKALALLAALTGYSATVIAQDAQIGDMRTVVAGVKSLKTEKERAAVVAAVTKHLTPHLAQDMDLEGLAPLVAAIADADDPTPELPGAMDDQGALAELLGKMNIGPDVIAKIMALCGGTAMDEDPKPDDKKDDKVDKPAMDAAIKAAVDGAQARFTAIRTAEIEVQPVIGTLAIAQDSAENVYKLALDHMKVDLKDVPPAAYRSVFTALRAVQPAQQPAVQRKLGMDSAASGAKTFADMFPKASKVGV